MTYLFYNLSESATGNGGLNYYEASNNPMFFIYYTVRCDEYNIVMLDINVCTWSNRERVVYDIIVTNLLLL